MTLGLTDRGRATIAAGATLAAAGLLLGFPDLTRVGLLAVGAVLVAAALVAGTRPHVEVDVEVAGHTLTVGESGTVRVRLTPTGRRTPHLRLEQPLPASLGAVSAQTLVPALREEQRFNLDLTVTFEVRGRHEIPPCTLHREDPFGLSSRGWTAATRRTVTVLPRVHEIDASATAGSSLRSEGTSRRLSALAGEEYGSIRDYRPGDDLRRIHWAVTAHRGELMTRHDERSSTKHALLVLDPRLADRAAPAVLEWGVELLASAAVGLDRAGLSFDLLTPTHAAAGGSASVGTHDHADDALVTLALVPSAARPQLMHMAVEDPVVELVREQASHAGLVVLAAGTSQPEATRDLLLALPPGTTGLVCLVSPTGDAGELSGIATQAGWTAQVCTPQTSHRQAWEALTAESVAS